ncbi:unnamed protein product [Paramecium pentaurelia]|uniref:Homeodomain protein n=1 Tax=Paramecium pentaurelia TaxID=43138 RepID=A0A8S1V991_9CILI|nr:unnamed protein product [Paramecium pentaurelia]
MISKGNNQEVEQQVNLKHHNKKYWSSEEDTKLYSAVILHGSNWKIIAEYLSGRNASQCAQRWKRIKPKENERNQKWSKEEDDEVLRLTKNYQYNWRAIAQYIPNRTGRQIRERFVNHLDPNIIKSPWTQEEDKWIWNMYQNIGTKWSDMSKQLSGRPENMIKNRFYSYIRKQYGKIQNPYYVVPNNVRFLEKDSTRKSKIIKKIKKLRRFCQIKKSQEVNKNKDQYPVQIELKVEQDQYLMSKEFFRYEYQQQQQAQQQYYPLIPTEFQKFQFPQIIYPCQFVTTSNFGSEYYALINSQDILNCQKEQINQSTFSDMTKSQNNEIGCLPTLNLQMIGFQQIQQNQIVTKEEEEEENNQNPKILNKITDKSFPLQIRADIIEELQKKNLEFQFKQ